MIPSPRALAVAVLVALASGTLSAQVAPAASAPPAPAVQGPRPTMVVQIAGANLYLDAGTDAGVRTGDTLIIRRSPTAAPVGSTVVIASTGTRSVVTFVGTPFPVTRGDSLFITPVSGGASAVAAALGPLPTTRSPPRRIPRPDAGPSTRVDGALGLEMWGSHSETVGLGADPVRTTRNIGIPAVRLRTRLSNDNSSLDLNLRAEHRTGPTSVFDRATRIRVYQARYDRRAGALNFSAGRFFSDFDHASGFWDGVSLRVGDYQGVFGGVAAGFEPLRGNEEFSLELPKAALFVGSRSSTERVDLSTDLSYHQTFSKDVALERSVVDFAFRLRAGRYSLSQDIELAPPTPMGTWGLSRFILRGGASIGRAELYAAAVSDRPIVMDTAWVLPLERRERISAGVSMSSARGYFGDVNFAINGPRDSTSGFSAGAMAAFPGLIGGDATLSINGSFFTADRNHGFTAAPSVEYRLGLARLRGGYQFFKVDGPLYSITTHGLDFRFSRSLSTRTNWVVQVNSRVGHNVSSSNVYSSFELRF